MCMRLCMCMMLVVCVYAYGSTGGSAHGSIIHASGIRTCGTAGIKLMKNVFAVAVATDTNASAGASAGAADCFAIASVAANGGGAATGVYFHLRVISNIFLLLLLM